MAPLVQPLDQLGDLLTQLEVRNLHQKVREFLKAQGFACGQGWSRIRDVIEKRHAEPGFLQAFEVFVRDAVLVSYKRVYLLARPVKDSAGLVPPLPEGVRRDYLAAEAPPRDPEGGLSFFLDARTQDRATITTFVTARPVRRSEEVDPANLNEAGQQEYRSAKIMARYDLNLRCYDHLVQLPDQSLLLIDAPDGVDGSTLSRDEANYVSACRDSLGVAEPDAVFIDLFPAIARLWRNPEEGIVNLLEFVSNKRAQIKGRFSTTSKENYRNHEFQIAGEKAAQVEPYRIAVKWTERAEEPMVLLPGRAHMAMASSGDHAQRLPLFHMEFPTYTSWPDFPFALNRVRAHLQSESEAA